jgi:hypothetical protein
MVSSIFSRISQESIETKFTVIVSIAEIYQEAIKDLLDPKKDNLKMLHHKSGTKIQDITEYLCSDE